MEKITPIRAMQKIKELATLVKGGRLSLKEAKLEALPYLAICNERSQALAKKFGVTARLITLNSFIH